MGRLRDQFPVGMIKDQLGSEGLKYQVAVIRSEDLLPLGWVEEEPPLGKVRGPETWEFTKSLHPQVG